VSVVEKLNQLSRENANLLELLREALPFVETYETGEILTEGMSRATYDNLVIRIRLATLGEPS